jgi:hypothetical protein
MTKPSDQVQPQPNQRLPEGHFDSDGKSQGAQTGAVRKSPDAYQEKSGEKK